MGPNIPLELAQSARDKLQASAREIWSSIRSIDDADKEAEANEAETPTSAEGSITMSFEKIESVLKTMFGSCTSGIPPHNLQEPTTPTTTPYDLQSKKSRSRDFVASKDFGEHVYENLFIDDQARATRAVDGLRERATTSPPSKAATQPFRVPSPTDKGHSVPAAPPSTRAVDISTDFSFDDSISAISAHTLEEMARVHEHKANHYSKNKLAAPKTKVDYISHPRSNRSRQQETPTPQFSRVSPILTPVKFTRGRSHGTQSSKATKSSKGTKSTSSTQDSEFASVWRKEEAKYWDDVVQQDKKKTVTTPGSGRYSLSKKASRRRSQSGSYSTKHDITVATASSSSYSNLSSHYHPHDVIQFHGKDLVASPEILRSELPISSLDRSRIQKCMQVPFSSELGEI